MTEHIGVHLAQTARAHADRIATRIHVDGKWRTQSYRQFSARVESVAYGLISGGVEAGHRVALFAPNSPEWSEVDFGTLTAGAVLVPLYSTSTPDQIRHIMTDSGSRVMFIGGRSEGERLLEVVEELPDLERIVTLTGWDGMPESITTYEDFLLTPEHGVVEKRLESTSGEDLASIIYTSGTTGPPKGVMLHHKALIAQKRAVEAMFDFTPEDHSLAFLPLSHSLERGWTTVVLLKGCMNTYVSDPRTVAEQLRTARPTMMASVPRLFETVFATAREQAQSSPVKRRILTWAMKLGHERARRGEDHLGPFLRAQLKLADRLVFSTIRDGMGGPKNVLACGGAPIRREVEEFFAAVDMPVFTGYGLTEASPLVSFNSPHGMKIGSAGKVMAGSEIKISSEGEILYRGPNLMSGYWNDDQATSETLIEGWLHTGDIGHIDNEGFLFITDRIKDIIVTVGGKNVAPQPIETMLLADPLFDHVVLIGDNRPFLTLLVKPSEAEAQELAKTRRWTGPMSEWLRSEELLEEVRARVVERTAKLPSQEQPKEVAIMDEEPTMDNDMLTPTLKIKRRQVEQRFGEVIDEMYTRLEQCRKGTAPRV